MAKFLTDEWAKEMTEALNSSDEFKSAATGQSAKLQQVITNTPEGEESRHYFKLENGEAEVALGELADAEVTITQDYETAAAIYKQELNPQNAFMQGKLKVTGNMMKLMQLQGVFNSMSKTGSTVAVDY